MVRELVRRQHDVVALARSDAAAQTMAGFGAACIRGDIRAPEKWLGAFPKVDAVIHAASDFNNTVAESDRRLLDALLPHLAAQPQRAKLLYTGGCWLFGATGHRVATEASPLRPLPADSWWLAHVRRLFEAPGI